MSNPGKGKPRKLVVKKETLRSLTEVELEQVNGGAACKPNNCTARLSGCISCPDG